MYCIFDIFIVNLQHKRKQTIIFFFDQYSRISVLFVDLQYILSNFIQYIMKPLPIYNIGRQYAIVDPVPCSGLEPAKPTILCRQTA